MLRLQQVPTAPTYSPYCHGEFCFPHEVHGAFQIPRRCGSGGNVKPLKWPSLSSVMGCKGFGVSSASKLPKSPAVTRGGKLDKGPVKFVDITTLGNLCVDIVLNVPSLPPASLEEKKAYMERLLDSRPDKKFWEAGGNCNLVIAAARLGLQCVTLGHVGSEIYGNFLRNVLKEEGIVMVGLEGDTEVAKDSSYETLLCWVLVDSLQRHGFCSRADFSKDPAFYWMDKLSDEAKTAIKESKTLYFNGYAFDELFPSLILSALKYAVEVETTIFFDPGPRGKYLIHGMPEQQKAIKKCLQMSDVLLLTADEAAALTGEANPVLAGQELIRTGVRTKLAIIKMGASGSILISASAINCAPSFKVDVVDTVGCGDSCTAAVIYGLLHGLPPMSTLALMNAVGGATAMGCGGGRNVASLKSVIGLLLGGKLNEDDRLWTDLTRSLDASRIFLLSETVVSGCSGCISRIPRLEVVSDLLAKLRTVQSQSSSFLIESSQR